MKIRTGLSLLACTAILLAVSTATAQDLSQSAASAPLVVATSVLHPSASVVTVQGIVSANNSPTQFWLACGTSTNSLPLATPKASMRLGTYQVSSTVTGLHPNTTYYFRLYASNVAGITASSIQSVTTGDAPNGEQTAAMGGSAYNPGMTSGSGRSIQ